MSESSQSEDSSQEKTEQPSEKRLQDARKKGQVVRSKELSTFMTLIVGGLGILFLARMVVDELYRVTHASFTIERDLIFNAERMLALFGEYTLDVIIAMFPFLFVVVVAALLAPALVGGWSFSSEALQPKLERIDPLQGVKRIVSWRGVMELLKAIAKFLLVTAFGILIIWLQLDEVQKLSVLSADTAIIKSFDILQWSFLALSAILIIVVAIDVPYQLYAHNQKMMMTHQEVKEEYKQLEGRPEVKSKLRGMQQQRARQRMMADVPKADVVITNPEHYAVALTYDDGDEKAPILVAKGVDLIADTIRNVANQNDVPLVTAPPLARSIFHNTDIGEEIPVGLYKAVAQVLAYVYGLKTYHKKGGLKPKLDQDLLDIPQDLRHDPDTL